MPAQRFDQQAVALGCHGGEQAGPVAEVVGGGRVGVRRDGVAATAEVLAVPPRLRARHHADPPPARADAGLAGYMVNAGLAENVRVEVFWSEVARQAPSVYRPCLVHELVTSGTDWRGKPSGVPVDKQPGADREQCRGV